MNFAAVAVLGLVVSISAAPPADSATVIGAVSRIAGEGASVVDGASRKLAEGAPIHLGEQVTTGGGARLEITFDDNTVLTLGENSTVTVDEFVYAPGGDSAVAATVAGAFRYVSAALKPGESRTCEVTTPFAVIGVRGTDFWGGPIDGAFGVFLIDGSVSVSAGSREVVMSAPGEGVTLDRAGAAPSDAFLWAPDRVARAVATVTFP
jgi:hypothetical protein